MARILVVDDNPNNLKLAAYMLATIGHDVAAAPTCRAAYAEAKREAPDMVLLDLNMPGDDPVSLTARLHDDVDLAGVPVALCTATATAGARAAALEAGFTAEVPKPYDLEVFRRDIERFLADHCPAAAPPTG